MGSIDLLTAQAGTRTQATPAAVAVRHGCRRSQATWPPALPMPAACWWAVRRARKGAAWSAPERL